MYGASTPQPNPGRWRSQALPTLSFRSPVHIGEPAQAAVVPSVDPCSDRLCTVSIGPLVRLPGHVTRTFSSHKMSSVQLMMAPAWWVGGGNDLSLEPMSLFRLGFCA